MYSTQPFVRSHTGFLPQRMINSFPMGACDGFEGRNDIFYNEKDRDFIVNMAGCEYSLSECTITLDGGEIVWKRCNITRKSESDSAKLDCGRFGLGLTDFSGAIMMDIGTCGI
jgi:galactosyl transferase GMA12/MNN10 family